MRINQILLVAVSGVLAGLFACNPPPEIIVGFVGGLSGRNTSLGMSARDAILLAVEEQNEAGGIQGRPVRLLVKNDAHTVETALRVDRELIEAGAVAIIGHMTSAMSLAALPLINENRTVMLSPTASSNELTGRDDYFFRIYPASAQTSRLLAERVVRDLGRQRVQVIYDTSNLAFTESAFHYFRIAFERLGGEVPEGIPFQTGPTVDFAHLARQVRESGADCLYILANAMDTAMICQQLAKISHPIQVVTSDWSVGKEVIEFGGHSVEGLFIMHTVQEDSQAPAYLAFVRRFEERFGRRPNFAACHAYDAARLLLSALERAPEPDQLRETLLAMGEFEGLQSPIVLNEYGDVERMHFPVRIHQGRFVAP